LKQKMKLCSSVVNVVGLLYVVGMAAADVSLEYPNGPTPKADFNAMSMSAHFGGEIPEEGIVGTLARAIPLHGCTKLNNTAAPNGQRAIVYMERDRDENVGCHFTTKVKNAQEAGFSAAIIFDIAVGPLVMMAGDDDTIHIPSVFVAKDVGATLMEAPNTTIATLTPDSFPEWPQYFTTMAAAAACAVLLFAMFVVYRRQHRMIRSGRRTNRMTRRQAVRLPSRSPTPADADETCCICLDEYHSGEVITDLPCGHFFHKKCIDPWLMERDRVCPICKRDPMAFSAPQNDRTPLLGESSDSGGAAAGGAAAASTTSSSAPGANSVVANQSSINADSESANQMV